MDTRTPRSYDIPADRIPAHGAGVRARWEGASPRWRLIGGIAGVLVLIFLGWLIFKPAPPTPAKPPPPVRVAKAWIQNITIQERAIGTIVPNSTVQVTARVQGQLDRAYFKEGDIVHEGDLLFQLDPRPFQAALEQAAATQARDQASLVSAQHDAARYQALVKEGAVSQSQADQFTAQAKALQATVVADKANVDAARLNLTYSSIHSPINGKTGPILVQPGNQIQADGTNALVVITQVQPVKISFFLPQTDLPRIQDQMRSHRLVAVLQTHDALNTQISAPVDFIGNAVDNTTGTVELRATFANQDYRLVPGQLIDVMVSLAQIQHSVVVPRDAVNVGPTGRYVFTLGQNDIAVMQPVTVVYDDGHNAAITGKVRAGDPVITDGQLRVIPGKSVQILKGSQQQFPGAGNPGSEP